MMTTEDKEFIKTIMLINLNILGFGINKKDRLFDKSITNIISVESITDILLDDVIKELEKESTIISTAKQVTDALRKVLVKKIINI